MAGVTVKNLSKKFGDFVAVNDISLDIKDGELVFFLGPSGCGKTTTLRMIAGLLMPTDGEIRIGGRNVTYLRPRHRNVGMVFQQNVLYHHLSVFDNLAYPLKVRGMTKKDIRTKVGEVADLLQIGDVLHRSTDHLSGGQAQRVAIGRMLVRDADIFLMDEPISHLDAKLRAHMRTELRHLQQELGRTTIFVSHDQLEAMSMADRIVVMQDGEVQQFDDPRQIFDRPKNQFVASFVGEPHMNILPISIENGLALADGFSRSLDENWLNANNIGEKALNLGVRPEHVEIHGTAIDGSFPAKIEIVEPMGAENLFSFTIAGQGFKVRSTTQNSAHIAEQSSNVVHLKPKQDHLYLFNRDGGKTLAYAKFTEEKEAI